MKSETQDYLKEFFERPSVKKKSLEALAQEIQAGLGYVFKARFYDGHPIKAGSILNAAFEDPHEFFDTLVDKLKVGAKFAYDKQPEEYLLNVFAGPNFVYRHHDHHYLEAIRVKKNSCSHVYTTRANGIVNQCEKRLDELGPVLFNAYENKLRSDYGKSPLVLDLKVRRKEMVDFITKCFPTLIP